MHVNYIDPQQLSRLIVHTTRDKILHLAISCTDSTLKNQVFGLMRYDFPLAFLQFHCKYDQRQPSSTTTARVPFSEVWSRQEKLYVIAGSPIKTIALARGPRTAADRRHT